MHVNYALKNKDGDILDFFLWEHQMSQKLKIVCNKSSLLFVWHKLKISVPSQCEKIVFLKTIKAIYLLPVFKADM